MLKGINIFIILFAFYIYQVDAKPTQYFYQKTTIKKSKTKNKKSRKNIKKLCTKSKRKIILLESKARKKSTPKVQRCKRAYSELRYQSCHLKKYNQTKVDAAKHCGQ